MTRHSTRFRWQSKSVRTRRSRIRLLRTTHLSHSPSAILPGDVGASPYTNVLKIHRLIGENRRGLSNFYGNHFVGDFSGSGRPRRRPSRPAVPLERAPIRRRVCGPRAAAARGGDRTRPRRCGGSSGRAPEGGRPMATLAARRGRPPDPSDRNRPDPDRHPAPAEELATRRRVMDALASMPCGFDHRSEAAAELAARAMALSSMPSTTELGKALSSSLVRHCGRFSLGSPVSRPSLVLVGLNGLWRNLRSRRMRSRARYGSATATKPSSRCRHL